MGIHDQKNTENINKKMRSWIQNELGKNDPLVSNYYVVFLSQTRYSISLSLISLLSPIKDNISVSQGFDRCIFCNPRLPPGEILDWFSKLSDKPWVTIDLPPNLYSDSSWMGLVLCAYFDPVVHFDILDSDTSRTLICHLETNVGHVRPLHGYSLTEENLVMLQQGGCILLSYRGRNCLNQANCVVASFTTDWPGLKVEICGLRLLYHYELEEFEQTILSHSMNSSSSDDWDLIHQLPTEDGNRNTQKHDYGEGTSSSRKESNFGSLRRHLDPKDKGKRVKEECSLSWIHD